MVNTIADQAMLCDSLQANVLFCSPSSPLHDRLMRELETVESCIEVVTAEMAALCCALQQHKKNVSTEHIMSSLP